MGSGLADNWVIDVWANRARFVDGIRGWMYGRDGIRRGCDTPMMMMNEGEEKQTRMKNRKPVNRLTKMMRTPKIFSINHRLDVTEA